MSAMAPQITSLTIVYFTVYSGADQRKHQSSASLAFVWGIHRWPVNSPHKGPVTRKMFPFDDVIMTTTTTVLMRLRLKPKPSVMQHAHCILGPLLLTWTKLKIPMLKIRRSHERLIFNMRISIPGRDGLYIEAGPCSLVVSSLVVGLLHH